MTTQPTTDLPAGPELDLAVARACHGKDGDSYIEDRPGHLDGDSPHCSVCWELEGGAFQRFRPSTNISDAFEALGVMRGKGWLWAVGHRSIAPLASLYREDDTGTSVTIHAETITLAICRAIVRAGKGGGA